MDFDQKQRIVILGAAGFIGFHLAKYFNLNCKNELLLIDNFSRGNLDTSFEELSNLDRVKFIELDLSLESSYLDLFSENDIVINCAAYNGTQNFYSKPVQVIRNSGITAAFAAEFCAKAKVKKYVYFASSESYAGGVNLGLTSVPTDEKVPLVIEDINNPRWSYAASKTFGEVSTIANYHQFNLNFIILRIHNVYGPRMGFQHVIPDLIRKFKNGDTEVHGVDESRAFFYVEDLCQIVFSLIFSKGIKSNCIYNVGSTNEIKVKHLAAMILEEMGLKLSIKPMPSFIGSVSRRCPDTSLIRDQVAYQETDLKQGLKLTIAWYLSSGF
jgi:nucleoside-diphosphate-sugar epimerase